MATKNEYLEIIRKWKHIWMNQTQNSEEDRKNYFDRAFGIDSNMMHHLADMLTNIEGASIHEYAERATLELAEAIIKIAKARKALEDANWFIDHVMGKEKRIDWGNSYNMDWGKVNECLLNVSQTLKTLSGVPDDTKSN